MHRVISSRKKTVVIETGYIFGIVNDLSVYQRHIRGTIRVDLLRASTVETSS